MLRTFVRDGWQEEKKRPVLDMVLWGDQRSNDGNTSFRVRFLEKPKTNFFMLKTASPVYHIAVTPCHEGDAVQKYLLPILQNVIRSQPAEFSLKLRFITGSLSLSLLLFFFVLFIYFY